MNKVNELTLCRDDYESKEEWQNEIGKAMLMLANAGYSMVSKLDDCEVFVIEYDYADQDYGADYPYWLSLDEWYSVVLDEDRKNEDGE